MPELAAGVAAGAARRPDEPLAELPELAAFDPDELRGDEFDDLADCALRAVPSDAVAAALPAAPGRL